MFTMRPWFFCNRGSSSFVKAKVPIVILTVRGAYDIQKNYPWKRSVVRMDICEVMSADKVSGMKTGEIGDYVRDVMNNSLTEG